MAGHHHTAHRLPEQQHGDETDEASALAIAAGQPAPARDPAIAYLDGLFAAPASTQCGADFLNANLIEADAQALGTAAAIEAGHVTPVVAQEANRDETAYVWDLRTDVIRWEANAQQVLELDASKLPATGEQLAMLIAAEHQERRRSALVPATDRVEAPRSSIPYRVHYQFRPGGLRGGEAIWLEDHGRRWIGRDGRSVCARGVLRKISESYIANQQRQHSSDFDELTGQLNRIRLNEALETVIERSKRSGQSSAFLIAAINNLSVINETFGFDVGDEVIRATGNVIKERLRGGDALGRYSSNKFGIVLNECSAGSMRMAAERFMKAVRSTTIQTSACQISATISVGGVIVPRHAESAARATSCGLQAIERAREKAHDTFVAYTPQKHQESVRQRNIKLADEIMSALDDNRLRLMLQPLVSAKTDRPALYECLLRLQKSDGELVSAGEFIVVAEQLGLARLLDRRTLELALTLLKKHPNLRLSVNVSSLTTSDPDWMQVLKNEMIGNRPLAERLYVEITETAAIEDVDHICAFVETVKELGCRTAIDDFGAGYTSFKNLKHLDVDMLKIDGAFVKNLNEDPSDLMFIKMMVQLADAFEMETVAEWVGDEKVARMMKDAGVTYLQGYHYGMPSEIEDLTLEDVVVDKLG